jgi:hypothetical protein
VLIAIPLAGLMTTAVGMVFGLPAARLKGLYLAIATLASTPCPTSKPRARTPSSVPSRSDHNSITSFRILTSFEAPRVGAVPRVIVAFGTSRARNGRGLQPMCHAVFWANSAGTLSSRDIGRATRSAPWHTLTQARSHVRRLAPNPSNGPGKVPVSEPESGGASERCARRSARLEARRGGAFAILALGRPRRLLFQ